MFEKKANIQFSEVRNDISVVYTYGGGPWGLFKMGPPLITRYFNKGAELLLYGDSEQLITKGSMQEAKRAVNFMFEHHSEPGYFAVLRPASEEAIIPTQASVSPETASVKKWKPQQVAHPRAVAAWILSGNQMNWKVAIEKRKWGVRPDSKKWWDILTSEDLLIFYVTRPVSGVIGFGKVLEKCIGESPLWPDAKADGKVIYSLRWCFEILYCLREDTWFKDRIPIRDPRLVFVKGINPCWSMDAVEGMIRNAQERWGYRIQ